MPVSPSFDDLIEAHIAEAQGQRDTLRFDDGNVTEAQAHGAAAMGDMVLRYAAQSFKETFLDGAEGDALTARVADRTGIERNAATRAQVEARIARTSGGAGGTIPAGTIIATIQAADGSEVRFETDADQVVAAAANGPWSIAATCTVLGPDGNVSAGTVTRIVDVLFDSSFTVTNDEAAGGGNAEETDQQLRVRARKYPSTLRRGTLAAIEFGALQVASVRTVKATEDPDTGLITVVVGDADGNSTAEMVSDARAEIENWRAAGTLVTVVGSTRLLVDIVAELDVDDGVDAAVLAPLVVDAMTARMAKQRQGELLHLDSLKAAGIAVDPDGINAINFTTPSATVSPTSTQTIRAGTIAIT